MYMQNKRVVAIHDLSGVGRCSLTVIMPILSAMGVQACPVPTAILSTHTGGFGEVAFQDLTDYLPQALAHYQRLGLDFSCIYSGFLGSEAQIDHCLAFFKAYPSALAVVDPVMGDHGKPYRTVTEGMRRRMVELVSIADVITPNLTELFYLLDKPYKADNTDEELKEYLRLLSDKGPQVVIITSVPVHDEPHKTSVYAYNRQGNRYWKVTCPYLPAHYPGTGDTFTSVITGSLMQGDSLPMALDRATQFILQGIRATFGYEYDNREGILLEKVLHNLDMPIQMASYELI